MILLISFKIIMNLGSVKLKSKQKIVNIEKVCRICMSEKGPLRNVYQNKISKMMEACASVRVIKDDDLPSNICVTCFKKIMNFYAFKRKIEHSDKLLRKIIKNKIKRSDILNVALSKANIYNRSVSSKIESEVSDEDIPLSERLMKQESRMHSSTIEIERANTLCNEPPPLIPLAFESKNGTAEHVVLSLPPLIPLNPGVNNNILENIVPMMENDQFHCKYCDEKFVNVNLFNEHKLKSCQENNLKCNICKKDFLEKIKLIRHLKGHMTVKDHCCKLCNKRYPNASRFRNHLLSHSGERPFRCSICNKGFTIRGGLDRHLKIHADSRPYVCNICGQSFKVAEYLEKHKKMHTNVRPFSCTVCGKRFSQSQNLQVHTLTYHTNERPYLCNVCGKGFVSSSRLKRHLEVHTGFKPYECQYCPKMYTTSKNLKTHEKSHINKIGDPFENISCNVCDKTFSHPWRLAKHKKIHEVTYQCQYCSKDYSSENILNEHVSAFHGLIHNEVSIEFLTETENREKE